MPVLTWPDPHLVVALVPCLGIVTPLVVACYIPFAVTSVCLHPPSKGKSHEGGWARGYEPMEPGAALLAGLA